MQHLAGSQLWPELEGKEYPAPFLLFGRLQSPPGEAGEQEVGEDAGEDEDAGAKVAVVEQLLDQHNVKENVCGGKDYVEQNQFYGGRDCIRIEHVFLDKIFVS